MANIQHLYRGEGNPNDNPALELTGDAVGSHLYQDTTGDLAVWISMFYEEEGHYHHAGWDRLIFEIDLYMREIEVNSPQFAGQMGYSGDGTLFIAMWDHNSDSIRWRSTGATLGDWYAPPS